MSETTIERRLAAVLAADVADYSRHMGADEESTMGQWWAHRRNVIDPLVTQHRGRIVKHTGDGFLAEFASAMDAVSCALAMQAGIAEGATEVPEDKRIGFRMGVNLGDIMSDDEDIYGDGVNIAARIEALAEPGSVYISGSVHEQIRSKPAFDCEPKGEHELKNIAEPVRVFLVRHSDEGTGPSVPVAAVEVSSPTDEGKPSIAVLPFDNMSGDPEQEYFADGITEDLITDLSKFSGLLVIARNSVFTYKGQAVNVPDVCKELGVRWALEGSVRKAGNRVRVNAQLIDGETGGHLWADRFDRDLDDIFAVQDEVTAEIVSALKLKITADEQKRMSHRATDNVAAYDMLLRARDLIMQATVESTREARDLITKGLEDDPDYATAMGGMAMSYITEYSNQFGDDHDVAIDRAEYWADKACKCDAEDPMAIMSKGICAIWRNRLDLAREYAEHLLKVHPNSMDGYRMLGNIENYGGNPERAIDLLLDSMRLDPHFPDLNLHVLGQCYFALGRDEEAADAFRRRIERNPGTDSSHAFLAGTYGHLGRFEEAKEEWAQTFKVTPGYSLADRASRWPYQTHDVANRLYDGLEKAGIDAGPRPWDD